MNAQRLERSLRLLRAANRLRAAAIRRPSGDAALASLHAAWRLEQHDADARERRDVRQTSIFDVLEARPR